VTDPTPEPIEPTKRVKAKPVDPASIPPKFSKEPQPDLPLELRKEKAGWNRNRIGTYFVIGGFGLVLIIIGLVGVLTKAR
jgi:hypothetical protein